MTTDPFTPAEPQPKKSAGWGKKLGLGLLGLIVFSGCVGAVTDDDTERVAQNSTVKESPTPATSPAKSPAPKKAKNPLDTDDNETACQAARREVGKRGGIFGEIGKGTALPEDGVKAAKKLQEEMGDYASFASGEIQTRLLALSDAYGRMRVGLGTGDLAALERGVMEQNTNLERLDSLCTSIGE